MTDVHKKNLIDALELHKLPETDQIRILEGIGKVVYQAVFMRVMDILDDKQKDAFERVLNSSKTEQEIIDFLEEHVPHFDDIMQDEIAKFKAESMSFLGKLS